MPPELTWDDDPLPTTTEPRARLKTNHRVSSLNASAVLSPLTQQAEALRHFPRKFSGKFQLNDLKRPLVLFGGIFVTLVVALLFDKAFISKLFEKPLPEIRALSASVFDEGLRSCAKIQKTKQNPTAFLTGGPPANVAQRRNPRYSVLVNNTAAATTGNPILIKDATVLNGVGGRFEHVDVALANGLVLKIAKGLSKSDVIKAAQASSKVWSVEQVYDETDVTIINADGRYVTPGIVDMHSHVGAYSFPTMMGNADGNEMSSQTNPQLRVQDGINILDDAIDIVASGGVTTSLILPGSGTLMGGEAVAIKLIKPTSYEVEDMTINRNVDESVDGKLWRWMKMACGENPKRQGGTPTSRMGSGWLYRKRFEEARTTLRLQEDWCVAAKAADAKFGAAAHQYVTERFPDPLEQDSLVALLRGDVRVNIHCYETHDIEMMIRNKHEFGFEITAFHHALEAHLLRLFSLVKTSLSLSLLITLYTRRKLMARRQSREILHDAGVKVAYKSDHPVLNAQHLIYEAQKAAEYGLDRDAAFASVTSIPAERMGLGWRIGKLAVVIIDGFLLPAGNKDLNKAKPAAPSSAVAPMSTVSTSSANPTSYTITNVSKIFVDDGDVKKGSVVVEKGVVTCIGKCKETGTIYDLKGGVIIPGLIGSNLDLGLVEIPPEVMTNDGASSGLKLLLALNEAFRGGVLTSITVPATDVYSDAILKPVVALHVNLGVFGLSASSPSVSSQIVKLRNLLIDTTAKGPFRDAATGKIPLVVTAHDPNDIAKVLAIKREVVPDLRLIIAGASGPGLSLKSWLNLMLSFFSLLLGASLCFGKLGGAVPGKEGPSAIDMLTTAGVKVILSSPENGVRRNLLWEAGWAKEDSEGKAFGVEGAGVIKEGKRASLLGLNGIGPLGFGKGIQIIGDGIDVVVKPQHD
ncbi:hypothetical protein BC829DRAFT_441528 [Chytridium lagenaria]|nr:hypothetical protein BC829DRAFT_441528 [Chytridium lagenaria]